MFSKAILTFLTIGALWVNVSAAPIGPKDTEIQGWADRIALEDMTSGPHNPPSDPQISHPETYANPNIPEGRVVSTPPAPLEESRSKLPKSLTVGVPALVVVTGGVIAAGLVTSLHHISGKNNNTNTTRREFESEPEN